MRKLGLILHLIVLGIAAQGYAQAQGASSGVYPRQAIRVIVPLSAGGPTDIAARFVSDHLRSKFGVSVVVDNRPGAGGVVGMSQLARAVPDGYTLGVGNNSVFATMPLAQELPFDPEKDFSPITQLYAVAPILIVNAEQLRFNSLPELIQHAKSNPGKLTYAATTAAGVPALAMLLLQQSSGTSMVSVPYSGSAPVLNAMLGGHIAMAVDSPVVWLPQLRAGKARALVVFKEKRWSVLPDVPAIGEYYPGIGVTSWNGMYAPARTPNEIIEKLAAEIGGYLRDPEIAKKFLAQGMETVGNSPAELLAVLARDRKLFKDVVERAGIKP